MQKASNYRGIEFIRLSELPDKERKQLKKHLNTETIFKIQTDKELLEDCVLFSYYKDWFEHNHPSTIITAKAQPLSTVTID